MIKKHIQEGFLLKSKGYYKRAIEAFYKALECDNSSEELLLEIAELYFLIGNEVRSLEYVEQILNQNPTHIGALKLIKSIFEKKEAFAEAEQTAKNIYCISKQTEDLIEIFKLLLKQKKYEEIFEYKTENSKSDVFYYMALAKFYLNEINESEILVNMALDFDKENQDILLLKGKILLRKNKIEECSELLNKIEITDKKPETHNWAGLVCQYNFEYQKAIKHFLTAIKFSASSDEYYYNCASTYFKMGEKSLAKKYYNYAISLNPENKNYHFALANLYYSEKHYKRAMEELDCDFFEAKLLKAIILYDTGYVAIAKKELELLEKKQPDNELLQAYKSKINEQLKIS